MKIRLNFLIYNSFLFGMSAVCILISNIYALGQERGLTVTDIDGNVYNTVTIGTQVWMKENLKTTKYRNGDLIGTKYLWAYDDDESNVATYGRLYSWSAVTDFRGICPAGWHVPSDNEWTTLAKYSGGESIAGSKLKEAGLIHWKSPNVGTTDSYGFTALPGGYRNSNGSFGIIGNYGGWWSSTEGGTGGNAGGNTNGSIGGRTEETAGGSTNYAWHRGMASDINSALSYYSSKTFGFSVRCVRD